MVDDLGVMPPGKTAIIDANLIEKKMKAAFLRRRCCGRVDVEHKMLQLRHCL